MLPSEKKYYKYWLCISYIETILEKTMMEKLKICVYNLSVFLISILMKIKFGKQILPTGSWISWSI